MQKYLEEMKKKEEEMAVRVKHQAEHDKKEKAEQKLREK